MSKGWESFCVVAKFSRFDPKTVLSVTYLGLVISVQEVASFDKLRSVLGILNFIRRFVPDFARVTAPLVALTRKGHETVSRFRKA